MKRPLTSRFPRRVRIHGGEFDGSARAIHQAGEKVTLMKYEANFFTQAIKRIVRAMTFNERKQMLKNKTRKRLALVAVSAMGFGLLSIVVPTAANASITPTATVSPVRVTGTGPDTVPQAKISWTSSIALTGDVDTVVLTLTSAPTAEAKVQIGSADSIGVSLGTFTGGAVASLNSGAGAAIAHSDYWVGAGGIDDGPSVTATKIASLSIQADTAGFYAGTLTVTRAASPVHTVSFSFTTRGAVASMETSVSAATIEAGGTSTLTVTLKDAAGFVTQPLAVDSVTLAETSGGSFEAPTTSLSATSSLTTGLYDGVGVIVYTTENAPDITATLTMTPAGTLGTIAAQTATVTTTGANASTTLTSSVGIVTNLKRVLAGVTTGITSTPTYTAAPTVAAFSFTIAGFTPNISVSPSIAITDSDSSMTVTVDGVAYSTGVGLPRTTSSTGTVTLAIGVSGTRDNGDALTLDANGTITNVTNQQHSKVTFNTVAYTLATTTPSVLTTLAVASSAITLAGTVMDQWSNPAAGYLVTVTGTSTPSGSNKTGSATVGTDGTWSVTLPAAAATTTALSIDAVGTGVTSVTDDALTFIANFTETGLPTATTLTVAYGDQTDTLPFITMPTTGFISSTSSTETFTIATGVVTNATPVANAVSLTSTSTPAGANVTYTGTAGLKFRVAVGAALADATGVSTLTRAAGAAVVAYATTPGTHVVTMTSGSLTKTVSIRVATARDAAARNIAITSATSLAQGAVMVITGTITDGYGNLVDTTAETVTASVTGAAFINGSLTSVAGLTSDATGTFTVTLVATSNASGNAVVTFTGVNSVPATGPGQFGALAGRSNPASTTAGTNGFAASTSPASVTIALTPSTVKTTDQVFAESTAAIAAATTAGVKADAAKAAADAATDASIEAGDKADAATNAALDAVDAADAATSAAQDAETAALAAGEIAQGALDAAVEATEAANAAAEAADAATDAANAATDAANAATEAAEVAGEIAQAALEAAERAEAAALDAIEAGNAATDAANAAAEAADAATAAAEEATEAANAAVDAVAALSAQVATLFSRLKAQITALTNLIIKIQKKLKA